MASKGCISLFLAIFTLRNSNVCISTTNSGDVASYIEAMVNNSLCKYTALGFLDVNPYNSYVRFQ